MQLPQINVSSDAVAHTVADFRIILSILSKENQEPRD